MSKTMRCPQCGNYVEGKKIKSYGNKVARQGAKSLVHGATSVGGTATGAAIGSAILPGIGTILGAAAGFIGSAMFNQKVNESIDKAGDYIEDEFVDMEYEFNCPNCGHSWTMSDVSNDSSHTVSNSYNEEISKFIDIFNETISSGEHDKYKSDKNELEKLCTLLQRKAQSCSDMTVRSDYYFLSSFCTLEYLIFTLGDDNDSLLQEGKQKAEAAYNLLESKEYALLKNIYKLLSIDTSSPNARKKIDQIRCQPELINDNWISIDYWKFLYKCAKRDTEYNVNLFELNNFFNKDNLKVINIATKFINETDESDELNAGYLASYYNARGRAKAAVIYEELSNPEDDDFSEEQIQRLKHAAIDIHKSLSLDGYSNDAYISLITIEGNYENYDKIQGYFAKWRSITNDETVLQEINQMSDQYEKYYREHSISPTTTNAVDSNEQEYVASLKEFLEDGEICDRELRMLDRVRKSLGISEQRAAELEALLQTPQLTEDEKEYLDMYREYAEEGEITEKARRRLDRFASALGISPERMKELERIEP